MILNVDFALKRSNYTSLIQFICRKPQIFQTMNTHYQVANCKDIEMRKFEFVTKTRFIQKIARISKTT